MLDERDALREALGARGVDVIQSNDVEHGRAHEACHRSRLGEPQHRHRHDRLPDVLPVPAPAGRADVGAVDERQPVQMDAQQQDEQEAGEERGQGEADERQGGRDLIEDRVGAQGGVRADRDRDEDRQELGRGEDDERRGQALQDQGVDVDAAHERESPVAADHRRHPAGVADGQGIVEAELRPEVHAHLGRHVGVGGQLLEGIARRHHEDREQDGADPEEHRDQDQRAPQKILGHAVQAVGRGRATRPAPPGAAMSSTSRRAPRSCCPTRSGPRRASGWTRRTPRGATRRGSPRHSGSPDRSS